MTDSRNTNPIAYKRTLNRMGWSMLIFICLFFLFTVVSSICQPNNLDFPRLDRTWTDVITAVCGMVSAVCYMAPFFLTGVFYYVLSRRTVTQRMHLGVRLPREFPLLILAGLAILLAGAIINAVFCEIIGYRMPADATAPVDYNNPAAVILYMTVALAPAFAEEFLFRGVFYTNLRPYGRAQAMIISSLLFALMHQNIAQLFYTFLAGLAMALMYEITGSIWCSVFFHMFNNELSVLREVLYYGKFGEAADPFLNILNGIIFLLGSASLVILIVYYGRQASEKRKALAKGQSLFEYSAVNQERCDTPVPSSTVFCSLVNPGMITFTAVTYALMGLSWLLFVLADMGVA